MKKLFLIILVVASSNAYAARFSKVTTIKQIYSYSEQGVFDGDIAIIPDNKIAGCEGGFWLRKADTIGYRNTVSFLLSAFHSGTTVSFVGSDDDIWSGSGTKFCRVDQISLIKD